MTLDLPVISKIRELTTENVLQKCSNLGLVYERYVDYQTSGDKWEPRKKDVIKRVVNASKPLPEWWNFFQERWRKTISEAQTFEASPDFRFVTGLGGGSPLEVGFTFHRIYGFPLIPGSGLKGVARAYALIEMAEAIGTDDVGTLEKFLEGDQKDFVEKYPDNQTEFDQFRTIFGSTDQAGQVIFFDAIPLENLKLEADVMTPHYSEYYQGTSPPADWLSPTPIPFLTVSKETSFCFAVGWRGLENNDYQTRAVEWLKEGLEQLGAGAKTSSGYGYFSVKKIREIPRSVEAEVVAVEQNRIVVKMPNGEKASLTFNKIDPPYKPNIDPITRFRVGKTINVWEGSRNQSGRLQVTMIAPMGE